MGVIKLNDDYVNCGLKRDIIIKHRTEYDTVGMMTTNHIACLQRDVHLHAIQQHEIRRKEKKKKKPQQLHCDVVS